MAKLHLENSKDIKEFLEDNMVLEALEEAVRCIKEYGFNNSDTNYAIRNAQKRTEEYTVINHFYNSWHKEGRQNKAS